MPDHYCVGCQTPDVDPIYPVCDACRRRYPRLLISAALAGPDDREVYLARLTTQIRGVCPSKSWSLCAGDRPRPPRARGPVLRFGHPRPAARAKTIERRTHDETQTAHNAALR